MNTPALLVLVRHAESLRNKVKNKNSVFISESEKKKLEGYSDFSLPLSSEGFNQAKKTGKALASEFENFDVAFHSGYVRAETTLLEMKREFSRVAREHMKIEQNALIRERDCGYTYDMTEEESAKYFPFLQNYWKKHGGFFAVPPGGESLAQVTTRVAIFYEMLCRVWAGKKVLVVSHGGTIACFRGLIESLRYEKIIFWKRGEEPGNCNVTAYKFDDGSQTPHILLKNHIF